MAYIALTDQGNFDVDADGKMYYAPDNIAPIQFAKSEHRCQQNTYFADADYGRNPLNWDLSQAPVDRIADITRICQKYTPVRSVYEIDAVYFIDL